MTNPPPLITHLQKLQQEMQASDSKFARLLGVSRPLWSMIRRGQRPVYMALLRGVVRSFPEMDKEVIEFLRSDE